MSSFISPYRFNSGDSGDQLGWAVFLSAAVHLLAAGLIIYVLPALLTNKVGPPEIIEEPWIVHIPGDIRTNAYDEPQIDPRQASRDEGQVTKNTDQSKPPPSVREEPVIPVEDFVVPLGKVIDNPTQKSEELVRATVLPEISTPDVQPEPASAIIRGEDVGGGGGKGASEGTQELHPEIAGYYGLIRSIISRNWTTPNETFSLDITAVYAVTIEPDGHMSHVDLLKPSGNELYDSSVLRAINRSTHLPKLPPIFQGRTIRVGLMFNLSDLLRARPRVQTPAPDEFSADGLVQAREVF